VTVAQRTLKDLANQRSGLAQLLRGEHFSCPLIEQGVLQRTLIPALFSWQLTLFNDCDSLYYCEYCRSADGRVGTLELSQRDVSDPVEQLSAQEREQLERLSATL